MKILFYTLFFFLVSFTGFAEKVAEFPDLKEPHSVVVDGDELIFMDGFSVVIYSLDKQKPMIRFGKKGEGKGEFQFRTSIKVYPDFLVALDYMKTAWFSRAGNWIKEIRYTDLKWFNPGMEMHLIPIRENFVRITVDHGLYSRYVHLLDSKFNVIKKLHEGLFDWGPPTPRDITKMESFKMVPHRIDAAVFYDNIFISDSTRGFYIKVFDYKGNFLYTVNKNQEIPKVRIREDFKKKALESLKNTHPDLHEKAPKDAFVFDAFFPAIRHFQVADGHIYVTTYKENQKDHEMIIMDIKGNIKSKEYLPLKSFNYYLGILRRDASTISKGNIYEFVKNPATGTWELHRSKLLH